MEIAGFLCQHTGGIAVGEGGLQRLFVVPSQLLQILVLRFARVRELRVGRLDDLVPIPRSDLRSLVLFVLFDHLIFERVKSLSIIHRCLSSEHR